MMKLQSYSPPTKRSSDARLCQHQKLLLNFPHLNGKQKTFLKKNLNDECVKFITECAINLQNINLDEDARGRLKKYKRQIDLISKPHSTLGQRKLIIQRGGFLPVISTAQSWTKSVVVVIVCSTNDNIILCSLNSKQAVRRIFKRNYSQHGTV